MAAACRCNVPKLSSQIMHVARMLLVEALFRIFSCTAGLRRSLRPWSKCWTCTARMRAGLALAARHRGQLESARPVSGILSLSKFKKREACARRLRWWPQIICCWCVARVFDLWPMHCCGNNCCGSNAAAPPHIAVTGRASCATARDARPTVGRIGPGPGPRPESPVAALRLRVGATRTG